MEKKKKNSRIRESEEGKNKISIQKFFFPPLDSIQTFIHLNGSHARTHLVKNQFSIQFTYVCESEMSKDSRLNFKSDLVFLFERIPKIFGAQKASLDSNHLPTSAKRLCAHYRDKLIDLMTHAAGHKQCFGSRNCVQREKELNKPVEDLLELVLGYELSEIRNEQGGARGVAYGYARLRGRRAYGRGQCRRG